MFSFPACLSCRSQLGSVLCEGRTLVSSAQTQDWGERQLRRGRLGGQTDKCPWRQARKACKHGRPPLPSSLQDLCNRTPAQHFVTAPSRSPGRPTARQQRVLGLRQPLGGSQHSAARGLSSLIFPRGNQLCARTPASPSSTDCSSAAIQVGLLGMHTSGDPGPLFSGS